MKRLYVLTRKDLGLPYQAVQGAHAVAQFCLDHPKSEWKNGYLIFLEVEDMNNLFWWWNRFLDTNDTKPRHKRVPISAFQEPDLNMDVTALAVYTNGSKFKNLPLMGNDE